jgi:hypothetical protein
MYRMMHNIHRAVLNTCPSPTIQDRGVLGCVAKHFQTQSQSNRMRRRAPLVCAVAAWACAAATWPLGCEAVAEMVIILRVLGAAAAWAAGVTVAAAGVEEGAGASTAAAEVDA